MKLSLKTIGRVSIGFLNALWKLGLTAVGVLAVFVIVTISNEIQKSELNKGEKLSNYVKEFDKDGYVSLYNQREKKFTLKKLDWVSHNDECNIAVYSKDNKRGFFDNKTGKPLTEPIYDKAWNFYEGIGAVEVDGYLSFINSDFKPAFPHKFKIVRASDDWPEAIRFKQSQCVLAVTPDSIGVLDKKGNWIIEPEYQFISELSADSCRAVRKNNLAGVVDYNGKILIEPAYETATIINKGVVNVTKDGYQKHIAYDGTVLRNTVFDDIRDFEPENDKFKLFSINDKLGVLRLKDYKIVIPALYSDIECLPSNHFKATIHHTEQISSDYVSVSASSSCIILDENNNIITDRR